MTYNPISNYEEHLEVEGLTLWDLNRPVCSKIIPPPQHSTTTNTFPTSGSSSTPTPPPTRESLCNQTESLSLRDTYTRRRQKKLSLMHAHCVWSTRTRESRDGEIESLSSRRPWSFDRPPAHFFQNLYQYITVLRGSRTVHTPYGRRALPVVTIFARALTGTWPPW